MKRSLKLKLAGLSLLVLMQACSVSHKIVENKPYIWQKNDKLATVAERHQTTVLELRQLNHIYDTQDLYSGKKIKIPQFSNTKKQTKFLSTKQPTATGGLFVWPSKGSISSKYGLRHRRMHEGIDLTAEDGKNIIAADSGVVEFSGWKRGYGRVVIIRHKNRFKTLYAHNQSNLVSRGNSVRKGAKIAVMGSSGKSTGVHLHFEIQHNKKATNPLKYLPPHPKTAAQRR